MEETPEVLEREAEEKIGVPPQTGTGTIQLFLFDINDNAPKLVTPSLDICVGMEKGSFPIKAEDKDDFPFAGPFTFQLAESSENTKGVWKLGRTFEYVWLNGWSPVVAMDAKNPKHSLSMDIEVPQDDQLVGIQHQARDQLDQLRKGRYWAAVGKDGTPTVSLLSPSHPPSDKDTQTQADAEKGTSSVSVCLLLWRFYHSHAPFKNYFPLVSWKTRDQPPMHNSEESQQTLSQDMPDVRNPISPPIFGKNPSESSQTHEDMSDVGNPIPPTGNIPRKIPENHKRLHHIAYLEDDMMDSYPPHVYAEEGSMGDNASVWSLPFAEDLPPGFMDTLGAEFTTLSKIVSK
uniref:Uncharacterized protein n=1 Tax=Sphaerodactylus townsendi TaxID=933632 RepID=A0ACB8F644_9SAUR